MSSNENIVKENEVVKKRCRQLEFKCQKQQEKIGKLKEKMESLFERQQLEKDNAKLVTKYQTDRESRDIINDLTSKVAELENQLRERNK